jgi:hypothetical protein
MTTNRAPDATARLAAEVGALLGAGRRVAALRRAMEASAILLREPGDALRHSLRNEVFRQFSNAGDSYQANDFESVDYEQYELAKDLPLFRGPPLSRKTLARGDYFCVMGAAQTFGRLVRQPWPKRLSDRLDLPVLNLSRGGAGPEFFLDPRLIELARRSRFVVLQVMSGRSVGCDEYPGGRRITDHGKKTKVHRWDVLESLWNEDPKLAINYVKRWNENYLALYRRLRERIDRPITLVWVADRAPSDWKPRMLLEKLSWGSFPQLVGRQLHADVAALFDDHLELVTQPSREKPLSRSTGEPCPYFDAGKTLHAEFHYYPSTENHAQLADALVPWALGVLEPAPGHAIGL